MNKFSLFISLARISVILLLSTTVIYAEVSDKGAAADNMLNKTAVSKSKQTEQSPIQPATQLPESSSEPLANKTVVWQLHAEQWELARSGDTILSMPVLNRLIQVWLSDKQKKIEIQYPGGEDGELWVQELTDWLVALGIPSKYMIITPGSGADDVIKFNIIK